MKRIDLTGQTFGRLTVLELSDKLDSARARLWKCQCACGNITYTSSTKLTKGWKKSCGCLSGNYHPQKPKEKFAPFVDCVSYRPNISYGCVALKERLCETRGKCSFYKPKGEL